MSHGFSERRGYFALAFGLVVLDQWTKLLAHGSLRGQGPLELVPGWFNLSYSRNPGGLFGLFADWPAGWRAILLTGLPVLAIVLIAWMLASSQDADRPTLGGLGLILGGAVGNLIDRFLRGEVVDFLDVQVPPSPLADWLVSRCGTAHWPTFNLADSGIVVGSLLLLWSLCRPRPARHPAAGLGNQL